MKKKYNKSQILGGIAVAAFALAIVVMVCGMSNTVNEVKESAISREPDAILASAGLDEEKLVSLPVLYYDQKADECVNMYEVGNKEAAEARQFEWSDCEYYNKGVEQGLVDYYLDENYLPVAMEGGSFVTNKGVRKEGFKKWFNAIDGQSVSYPGLLQMEYNPVYAEFSFYNNEFYPLDGANSELAETSKDSHNHLFTMSFAVPFTVLADGNESFEVRADDDTWVYVGDELVVDLGGVHNVESGRFAINENGEVYAAIKDEDLAFTGVQVKAGEGELVRVFHADRDSDDSQFNVRFVGMNIATEESRFARGDEDGVQIAYDPSNPSYQAPLGVTSVTRPDSVKGFITIATLEGVFVVLFAVLMAVSLRFMVKAHKENIEKS